MRVVPHFVDRYDAGRRLGLALRHHPMERPIIVLGLPRGGVPVAALVAHELDAPLDVYVVRKLGVPGQEELALGAIASGGARLLNDEIVAETGLSANAIEAVVEREERELARREVAYRGAYPLPGLGGATVVLVDDGAATGASMRVAVQALRQLGARAIVVAVPVASREALALLREEADDVVCLVAPQPFFGVGAWYRDFAQATDEDVRQLLADARRRAALEHGEPSSAGAGRDEIDGLVSFLPPA